MLRSKWICLAALAVSLVWAEPTIPAGKRWWEHVRYLADDKLEGRGTGTRGYDKAAAYVAAEFERAGLEPAGTKGFLQPVRFIQRELVPGKTHVTLLRDGSRESLGVREDVLVGLRGDPPRKILAPLVFVGYGLTIPEAGHDDFAAIDARGKIVVYLRGGPAGVSPAMLAHYQSSRERRRVLEKAGAVGTISLSPTSDIPWRRQVANDRIPSMTLASERQERPLLNLGFHLDRAEVLFGGSGWTFEQVQSLHREKKPVPAFPLRGEIEARVGLRSSRVESSNVVAVRRGADPALRDEFVVLTAHLDHLGAGAPVNGDSIFNGAMDNAAGVASLIEMAQILQGMPLRRSVLFVAVTGEEKGLLGSTFFSENPTVPKGSMVANLNLDMYLPLFPLRSIVALGLEESTLGEILAEVAEAAGVGVGRDQEPERSLFTRSDQYSFVREGVPALAFKFGFDPGSPEEKIARAWLRERYHAPSDDVSQPVNIEAASQFNELLAKVTAAVANSGTRPVWKPQSFFRRFARQESGGD